MMTSWMPSFVDVTLTMTRLCLTQSSSSKFKVRATSLLTRRRHDVTRLRPNLAHTTPARASETTNDVVKKSDCSLSRSNARSVSAKSVSEKSNDVLRSSNVVKSRNPLMSSVALKKRNVVMMSINVKRPSLGSELNLVDMSIDERR